MEAGAACGRDWIGPGVVVVVVAAAAAVAGHGCHAAAAVSALRVPAVTNRSICPKKDLVLFKRAN